MKLIFHIVIFSIQFSFPFGQIHQAQFAIPSGSEEFKKLKNWCYQYPHCSEATWKGSCQTGQFQSPIDIPKKVATTNVSCYLDDFPLHTYESNLFLMESNGRTVAIKLLDFKPSFYWADQRAPYTLHSVHFHWGSNDSWGSEHTLHSHNFGMEMQMVHYKSHYKSIGDALDSGKKNALTIITVLFQVSPKLKSNLLFQPIFKYLPGVYFPNAVITVKEHLNLKQFLRGNQAYSYMGSLTSPGCNEQVAWIIWKRVLNISPEDIASFRRVKDTKGQPLLENFRSIQPGNNRQVKLCEVTHWKRKMTN